MTYPIILSFAYHPYIDVDEERVRAHKKHGAKGNSMEDATWTNTKWLPILMEEVGEIAHIFTYDSGLAPVELKIELRKELVQVAAMAIAWIESIDKEEVG